MTKIKIKRVRQGQGEWPLPAYQTKDSAGVDLMADIENEVIINPGERKLIPTGFSIELPHGFEAQIRPRSGLAIKKGITLLNSPGTIDSDYRGEISVIVINHGNEPVPFVRGDRIAQMVIAPVIQASFEESQDLSITQRGQGGFGSTGK